MQVLRLKGTKEKAALNIQRSVFMCLLELSAHYFVHWLRIVGCIGTEMLGVYDQNLSSIPHNEQRRSTRIRI